MSLDLGMTGTPGSTPRAPGRLGVPVGAAEALRYLTDLGLWLDERGGQLNAIDQAALPAPDQSDRGAHARHHGLDGVVEGDLGSL